jgi:O-antigen ligase
MNLKPSFASLMKPLLLALAVTAMTALFVYSQIMGYSKIVYLWFLALIALVLFGKWYPAIKSTAIKTLLFSMIIFLSLKYGLFFFGAKDSQLIGFFIAILLPLIFFYPRFMTYLNLVLIFYFSSSSYGISNYRGLVAFLGGIFSRGDVKYGISYANILLLFTALSIIFQTMTNAMDDDEAVPCNLYKYFWIFNAIFFIYMVWGITLGIDIKNILLSTGVIHLTNLAILVFIINSMFKNEKDFEQLKFFFLGSMVVRGGWSVLRFIFGDGDPRNVYANLLEIKAVKISLFDIGDGLIQCIGLFYALFMLFVKGDRGLSRKESVFYGVVAFVGLFNIMFSYRRTGWFGLLLAFLWLMMNLRLKQRIIAGLLALIVGTTLFFGIATSRFETSEKRRHGMFADIFSGKGDIDIKRGRFVELYTAWQTIKDNILFGVGPWGEYKLPVSKDKWGFHSDLTHSSVVHMMLKMGIIGLVVYLLIFYSYMYFWLKARKAIPTYVRGFAEAAFAGFIFFIPDILWGTPIIEYRHMLLLGFSMSIPYITYHIYKTGNLPEPINNANLRLKHL